MYKLAFYVPESHLEVVKQAIFAAGAGRYENYEHCCWQTLGQGQFKPMTGSNPFLGQQNQLETLAEYKVETICQEVYLQKVIAALKQSHPYEEPAYEVYQILK